MSDVEEVFAVPIPVAMAAPVRQDMDNPPRTRPLTRGERAIFIIGGAGAVALVVYLCTLCPHNDCEPRLRKPNGDCPWH